LIPTTPSPSSEIIIFEQNDMEITEPRSHQSGHSGARQPTSPRCGSSLDQQHSVRLLCSLGDVKDLNNNASSDSLQPRRCDRLEQQRFLRQSCRPGSCTHECGICLSSRQVVVMEHAGAHLTNTAQSAVKELVESWEPLLRWGRHSRS
jgi:hypothetical protein